eukprot:TRINITY_DN123208_c0_g1_i1.p1 TRINITY_DN123208_c0_g1~~TRINITY_DN123208_c0_g1_i1.p1  ORF type:complete len:463 (-),score=108.64 TRINITY_DN123208_c0_g1_i1:202-1590(-)
MSAAQLSGYARSDDGGKARPTRRCRAFAHCGCLVVVTAGTFDHRLQAFAGLPAQAAVQLWQQPASPSSSSRSSLAHSGSLRRRRACGHRKPAAALRSPFGLDPSSRFFAALSRSSVQRRARAERSVMHAATAISSLTGRHIGGAAAHLAAAGSGPQQPPEGGEEDYQLLADGVQRLWDVVLRRFESEEATLMPPLVDSPAEVSRAVGKELDPRRLVFGFHSPDAIDLVRERTLSVIGPWQHLDREFRLRIPLFQASQAYISSALFGYCLRRVDMRYRLEKLMGTLQSIRPARIDSVDADGGAGDEDVVKLKSYIASLSQEDVHFATTAVSLELQIVLEEQVSALFGERRALLENIVEVLSGYEQAGEEAAKERLVEAVAADEVPSVELTVSGLRRLILEAAAFGAVLSEAESEVGPLAPQSAVATWEDSDLPFAALQDAARVAELLGVSLCASPRCGGRAQT